MFLHARLGTLVGPSAVCYLGLKIQGPFQGPYRILWSWIDPSQEKNSQSHHPPSPLTASKPLHKMAWSQSKNKNKTTEASWRGPNWQNQRRVLTVMMEYSNVFPSGQDCLAFILPPVYVCNIAKFSQVISFSTLFSCTRSHIGSLSEIGCLPYIQLLNCNNW